MRFPAVRIRPVRFLGIRIRPVRFLAVRFRPVRLAVRVLCWDNFKEYYEGIWALTQGPGRTPLAEKTGHWKKFAGAWKFRKSGTLENSGVPRYPEKPEIWRNSGVPRNSEKIGVSRY